MDSRLERCDLMDICESCPWYQDGECAGNMFKHCYYENRLYKGTTKRNLRTWITITEMYCKNCKEITL